MRSARIRFFPELLSDEEKYHHEVVGLEKECYALLEQSLLRINRPRSNTAVVLYTSSYPILELADYLCHLR